MRKKALKELSPVVVFGTGGSGTRVVAEILRKSGCFIGENLNRALDNQDFGFFLGGRARWMEKNFPFEEIDGSSRVMDYLRIFKKTYFGQPLNLREFFQFIKICFEYIARSERRMFRRRPLHERSKRGAYLIGTIIFPKEKKLEGYEKWGFKSPEAIYFVEPMKSYFPEIKLIHLVRDGRDMALSTNRNPMNYRRLFKIEDTDITRAAFKNWYTVNKWAKNTCKKLLSQSQYLLIKYEDICMRPVESIDTILNFVNLNPGNLEDVYQIPSSGKSIGRWMKSKEKFDQNDLSLLNDFGYT